MQPRLQRIEGKPPVQLDDQFAVDDKSLERRVEQRRHNFGKKAAQGLARLSLQLDRAALLESQAAKAVPFRLELPSARFVRKRLRGPRLHWRGVEPQARQIRRFDCSRRSGAHPILCRKFPLSAHLCFAAQAPGRAQDRRRGCRSTNAGRPRFQSSDLHGAALRRRRRSVSRRLKNLCFAGTSAAGRRYRRPGEHQDVERFVAGFVPYCGAAPVPGSLHWKLDHSLSAPYSIGFREFGVREVPWPPRKDLAPASLAGSPLARVHLPALQSERRAVFGPRQPAYGDHAGCGAADRARIGSRAYAGVGAKPMLSHGRPRSASPRSSGSGIARLFYDETLRNNVVYSLMHVTTFAAALALWTAVFTSSAALAFLLLFATGVQMSLLGALLTFAAAPLFSVHEFTTGAWGLTWLEDQQLGGLVMWVPAGLLYRYSVLAFGAALRLDAPLLDCGREGGRIEASAELEGGGVRGPISLLAFSDRVASGMARADDLVCLSKDPKQWVMPARDYAASLQSARPNRRIERRKLQAAWIFSVGTQHGQEAAPLIVEHAVHHRSYPNKVFALDSTTGDLKWTYIPNQNRADSWSRML